VVARDHEQRTAETAQERRRPLVLATSPAMGEVARHGDQLGREPLDQRLEAALDPRFLDAPRMQV
jgi:hypothetical protein